MKKNNSGIISIALIAILAAGGTYAYTKGYLPFGGGSKAAEELKIEIEALKGNGIEAKVIQFLSQADAASAISPEDQVAFKQQVEKSFKDDLDINLEYSEIKSTSADGKANVEITSPKLSFISKSSDINAEVLSASAIISRDIEDKNHYYYNIPGDVEVYSTSASGERTKLVTIASEQSTSEIKLSEAGVINYAKSSAKNIRIIEGRGNTTLVTIGEVQTESSQNVTVDKMDNFIKASYKDIVPGDTIKMILGNIEPLSVNIDASYKGDNITKKFYDAIKESQPQTVSDPLAETQPQNKQEEAKKALSGLKPFDGELKISEISLLTGNAGFVTTANLMVKKDSTSTIPVGDATLKIAQYQKLLDLSKKFVPIPQELVDKTIGFLGEVGKNENGDLKFSIKLDGTENILVDGKTFAQIYTIREKYFPSQAGNAGVEPTTSAAPAQIPASVPERSEELSLSPSQINNIPQPESANYGQPAQ